MRRRRRAGGAGLGALELAELHACASTTTLDQRAVMQHMLDEGVATRRGIMCAHRERPYAGGRPLPNSEWAQDRLIVLPVYHRMPEDDIAYVVGALRDACPR